LCHKIDKRTAKLRQAQAYMMLKNAKHRATWFNILKTWATKRNDLVFLATL